MREAFVGQNFRQERLDTIALVNQVCEEYAAQGYNLTLRQVYYQFVARGWGENGQKAYKRLGDTISEGRMAGLIDWSHIEDRARNVAGSFAGWDDPGQFIEGVKDGYYEALWEGQVYRPEVWVEKESLVDIVARACGRRRVPHLACKGYMSQSEMYSAAKRMRRRWLDGLQPLVIHLGDHDPSGVDMTRDIEDRLSLMAGFRVDVRRVALNMDQIEEYQPPPFWAKVTDSRARGYIAEYGEDSWELDALDPPVLDAVIQGAVEPLVDGTAWDEAEARQRENQDRINTIADRWGDLEDRWDDVLAVLDR
jgi:hypothetical protein